MVALDGSVAVAAGRRYSYVGRGDPDALAHRDAGQDVRQSADYFCCAVPVSPVPADAAGARARPGVEVKGASKDTGTERRKVVAPTSPDRAGLVLPLDAASLRTP